MNKTKGVKAAQQKLKAGNMVKFPVAPYGLDGRGRQAWTANLEGTDPATHKIFTGILQVREEGMSERHWHVKTKRGDIFFVHVANIRKLDR